MYDEYQMIASNIKNLRVQKGYTQEQLAEAVGISTSHLSKVETGQRRIGMKTYLSILRTLKVEEEEYMMAAVRKESDEERDRLDRILEDCTKAEKQFLLDVLENIKINLIVSHRKPRESMTLHGVFCDFWKKVVDEFGQTKRICANKRQKMRRESCQNEVKNLKRKEDILTCPYSRCQKSETEPIIGYGRKMGMRKGDSYACCRIYQITGRM
ncbi:MAG: helix-turn-helix domain-containing protein [Frisingicoccus sp.]